MMNSQQLELRLNLVLRQIIICIFSLSISWTANANDASTIVDAVYRFTESLISESFPDATRYKITIRPPDPRFSFETCQIPSISLHGSDQLRSRILTRIDCEDARAIHIAVDVAIYKSVLVASTNLARNTLLAVDDISYKDINIMSNTRVYSAIKEDVIGKQLKRTVRTGTILTPGMLVLPTLVKRGDNVMIIAKKGPLVVQVSGVALNSGSMNQQISVRNNSSERVVKGWIRGPGEVHVPM